MKMITLPLGALETNCYVVYDEASKACALVDPGAMPQTILDTLEKNELALQKIFLTHAHFDHTGALRARTKNSRMSPSMSMRRTPTRRST